MSGKKRKLGHSHISEKAVGLDRGYRVSTQVDPQYTQSFVDLQ